MDLTEKQIENHKAWLQDQKPAHQAYVGVLIADKLTAAESALAIAKDECEVNRFERGRQRERAEAAESALEEANGKYRACMDRLNPSIEYVEAIPVGYGEDEIDRLNARLDAIQSRLDAAERVARRNCCGPRLSRCSHAK